MQRCSIHQPLRPNLLQDGRRNLFNRLGGGGQPPDACAAHHGLGFGDLHAAVLQAGVARIGAALGADLGQAVGADGQAKDLAAKRHQGRGQLAAFRPHCMARYRLVGVLPLRLTPTRITSAPARSRLLWPSSWARLKLMASMRSVYSLLRLTSLKRPTRWCDLMPSSCSSGWTKVPNISSSMPLQPSWMTLSTSMLTSVVKTMGFLPSTSPVWLICRTAWWALSTVSMKGRRTWRGFISNWARMALPKVSAVIPVPSETKNTVRECMEPLFLDAACASRVATTKKW